MLIYLNSKLYHTDKNQTFTIYQFCFDKGIILPCFCYHEKLAIAGNCRMCLVEVRQSKNLVIACSTPLVNNIEIFSSTKRVLRAREDVLEFLLVNHPLDCPICDKGGECDLQDISNSFGSNKGRFYEAFKKAKIDLDFSFFVKTVLSRCIYCLRCVRFVSDLAFLNVLSVFGRGLDMQVSTFAKGFINSEISGNIIDLCPVGALTARPYSFVARPWELSSVESIDFLDTLLSGIRIDYLNFKIKRILPIINESLNEDWITDKTRFFYDSFYNQRLYTPQFKHLKTSCFFSINWKEALNFLVFNLIKFRKAISLFLSEFLDIEFLFGLSSFIKLFSFNFFNKKSNYANDFQTYKFMPNWDELSFFLILLSSNLKIEQPLLYFKLSKLAVNKVINPIFALGSLSNFFQVNFSGLAFNFLNVINFKKKLINFFFFLKPSKRDYSFSKFSIFISNKYNIIFSNFLFFTNTKGLFFNTCFLFFFPGILLLEFMNYKFRSLCKKKGLGIFYVVDSWLLKFKSNFIKFSVFQGTHFYQFLENFNLILPVLFAFENFFSFFNIFGFFKCSKKTIKNKTNILSHDNIFKLCSLFFCTRNLHCFSVFPFLGVIKKQFCIFYTIIDFLKFNLIMWNTLFKENNFFYLNNLLPFSKAFNFLSSDSISKKSGLLNSASLYLRSSNVFSFFFNTLKD